MNSKSSGRTITAQQLGMRDIIEVPIEACIVVNIECIEGQLHRRGNQLLRIKVMPLSGPWANCEGVFVAESSDSLTLVRKWTYRDARKQRRRLLFKRICGYVFGHRSSAKASSSQPQGAALPSPSVTGPMT